jgi:hypothetical protein
MDAFEALRRAKSVAAIIAFACLWTSASAQRRFVSEQRPRERVIGLLDLPDITGNYADAACAPKQAAVQLYEKPSAAAGLIGAISLRMHPEYGCSILFKRTPTSSEQELPTEESGYEIAAAVVYERRGRWFRIAVPQGSAWIERTNVDDFLPYPQLLTRKLAYLRDDWDGQLRRTAGSNSPTEPLPVEWRAQVSRQIGVEVLGTRRVGNEDWIRVRFALDRCGDESVRKLPPVQGWLPAYRSNGTPSAWFHSRGC